MKPTYESPLGARYASQYMLHLFSPDMRFETWRRLWVSLARAEHALGLPITQAQVDELAAHVSPIDYELVAAKEKELRHDVMAHIYAFGAAAPGAKGIIHLGATSCYVTDNADLVQKVRNLAPDLIAVAGDMDIDTNPDYSLVLSLMRQLVDIAPVYYAPGNHEWAARYANGCDTIFDDIEATGVHWMNGTYEDAVINGKKLRIGGFFEWPRAQLERENSRAVADALNDETNALDDVCTILICHCPEVLDPSLADEKFDLVLSGHAHGGQVRIGGHGLWSTSQGFLPKYTSGVNQMGESQVVISRGLGDSEPYPRIFNQPELVVVDVN